jgi:hypothetical protein
LLPRTLLTAALTGVAIGAAAVPLATADGGAAARVSDIDADLLRDGRVRLEAETRGATRVVFTYAGRRIAGRLTEVDDGERSWARTVARRGSARTVTVRVTACDGTRCTARTDRERLEREDDR